MLYLLKYRQYHDPKVTNAGKIADGIIQRTFWGKKNKIKQLTTKTNVYSTKTGEIS